MRLRIVEGFNALHMVRTTHDDRFIIHTLNLKNTRDHKIEWMMSKTGCTRQMAVSRTDREWKDFITCPDSYADKPYPTRCPTLSQYIQMGHVVRSYCNTYNKKRDDFIQRE